MEKTKILRGVVALLVIALLGLAGFWFYTNRGSAAAQDLTASGSFEATEVQVAPELAGKVVAVMVDEGESFQAGAPLFRMDDELLQTQRSQAAAGLQVAKDNLTTAQSTLDAAEATLNGAKASAALAKANAGADLLAAQQGLQNLYDQAGVAKGAAEQAVAAAARAVREADYDLYHFTIPSDMEGMNATEALAWAKKNLEKAQADFEPYRNESELNSNRKDLKDALDTAQSDYDTAVRRLEYETALDQALARQKKAVQDLADVANGPKEKDIALAQARINAIQLIPAQADTAVAQAEAGVQQAQTRLDQARSAVTQAQAALDTVDVQLKKLTVRAQTAGVVLSRNIEPGAVVQPGTVALTVGQLENLKITVYVPEDRYGAIKLGQKARVTVDSFPGQVFTGVVSYIADQAEFTPRNVQTTEGRRTTVFAVKLSIQNADGRLKPGMPADVAFGQ